MPVFSPRQLNKTEISPLGLTSGVEPIRNFHMPFGGRDVTPLHPFTVNLHNSVVLCFIQKMLQFETFLGIIMSSFLNAIVRTFKEPSLHFVMASESDVNAAPVPVASYQYPGRNLSLSSHVPKVG